MGKRETLTLGDVPGRLGWGIKKGNLAGFIKQKTLQLVDFQIEGFAL